MTHVAKIIAVAAIATLAACGGKNTAGDNVAEQADAVADNIDNQADMIEQRSDTVSNDVIKDAMENQAEALENRADTVRDAGKKQGEMLDKQTGN